MGVRARDTHEMPFAGHTSRSRGHIIKHTDRTEVLGKARRQSGYNGVLLRGQQPCEPRCV